MLAKLKAGIARLLEDTRALSVRVERLEKIKPAVINGRDGKDGKDGVSPSVDDIVNAVIAQTPEPEKINTQAIVDDVLAQTPKPRDGRDAPAVNVSDVAAIVLSKIRVPKDGKDGRNGPDLETVVKRVKAQVSNGAQGERGPTGAPGKDGKDGVSVTDVQLNNNELFVFLDGKKRKAGEIKIPVPVAPFNPGNAGGGGSARSVPAEAPPRLVTSDYEAAAGDIILVDTSSGDVEVMLPQKGGAKKVVVKKISTDANIVTVSALGSIDGDPTLEIRYINTSRTFVEYSEDWFII